MQSFFGYIPELFEMKLNYANCFNIEILPFIYKYFNKEFTMNEYKRINISNHFL